jgi:hypothetical protein
MYDARCQVIDVLRRFGYTNDGLLPYTLLLNSFITVSTIIAGLKTLVGNVASILLDSLVKLVGSS